MYAVSRGKLDGVISGIVVVVGGTAPVSAFTRLVEVFEEKS